MTRTDRKLINIHGTAWSDAPLQIDCPKFDAMKNLADTEGRLKTKKKGMNQGRTNEWKECRELEKLRAEGRHRKIMMQPSENGGIWCSASSIHY